MDNATPHKVNTGFGTRFYAKCEELGIRCTVVYQPAQSPDMNICDLGFFNSIQSIYFQRPDCVTPHDIVRFVMLCFQYYPPKKLNYMYLTLFTNYNNIRLHLGRNNYKITHMGKEALDRAGTLPERIFAVELDMFDKIDLDYGEEGEDDDDDNNRGVEGVEDVDEDHDYEIVEDESENESNDASDDESHGNNYGEGKEEEEEGTEEEEGSGEENDE